MPEVDVEYEKPEIYSAAAAAAAASAAHFECDLCRKVYGSPVCDNCYTCRQSRDEESGFCGLQ